MIEWAKIQRILGDLAGGQVKTERIAFLKDQLAAIEKENAGLTEKLAIANAEVVRLRAENYLLTPVPSDGFIEECGALFKKDSTGKFGMVVYCPRCKTSTSRSIVMPTFWCGACDWHSPFGPGEVKSIVDRLNSEI